MDRKDWDSRYASHELLWGAEPNRFLAAELGSVVPRGNALDLACGEGRNAIWLAKRGWRVTAVDFSAVALERARRLAAQQNVAVDWVRADVTSFVPPAGRYELVLILYLHLPPDQRRQVLQHASTALAPSGELFLVGHALRNLTEGVGGPQSAELLWDPGEIATELRRLELSVERADEVDRPVESAQGLRRAIDVLARARRTAAPHRAPVDSPNRASGLEGE